MGKTPQNGVQSWTAIYDSMQFTIQCDLRFTAICDSMQPAIQCALFDVRQIIFANHLEVLVRQRIEAHLDIIDHERDNGPTMGPHE